MKTTIFTKDCVNIARCSYHMMFYNERSSIDCINLFYVHNSLINKKRDIANSSFLIILSESEDWKHRLSDIINKVNDKTGFEFKRGGWVSSDSGANRNYKLRAIDLFPSKETAMQLLLMGIFPED